MAQTLEEVKALLGRELDEQEEYIFAIGENDPNYTFVKGKDGSLEAHPLKKKQSLHVIDFDDEDDDL